jgi:hypothetical protein
VSADAEIELHFNLYGTYVVRVWVEMAYTHYQIFITTIGLASMRVILAASISTEV